MRRGKSHNYEVAQIDGMNTTNFLLRFCKREFEIRNFN